MRDRVAVNVSPSLGLWCLVCVRALTPWICCVPTDCTLLSLFPEIGDLASHLPGGGLRLSGQQEGQAEGEERGRRGEEGGRGSKNF